MIEAVGRSDIGKVRSSNQDAYHIGKISDEVVWSVVCDGMGGANGGNVASLVAVGAISANIDKNYHDEMDDNSIKNMLIAAISTANTLVHQKSKQNLELAGMGTTVVLTFVRGATAYIAHAGDSRAYHISNDKIQQITKDHTLVQYLQETGNLTELQARVHPKKHLITRALGVQENLEVDYNELELQQGDQILMCSDGLSNHVDENGILNALTDSLPMQSVENLIQAANEQGGLDNITAVLMQKC